MEQNELAAMAKVFAHPALILLVRVAFWLKATFYPV